LFAINAIVRKIFSSVCLALILLNVMGYYGVMVGMQYRHSSELLQQFDADVYNRSQALAIKIPARASQEYQSLEFQRM
jgi:predicted anti-sigma-YlaC factor YlaD